MIVYVIMTVARQYNGEMVFVKSEKGFTDKVKAEVYAKEMSQQVRGDINVPGIGLVSCALERGIYKVEVEEG